MVAPLRWIPRAGREVSPFTRGLRECPLSLTIHIPDEPDVNSDDGRALEALRQLSHLSDLLLVADSREAGVPLLTIDRASERDDYIPVTVVSGDSRTETAIWKKERWYRIAHELKHDGPENTVIDDVLCLAAHESLGHDIFVTSSSALLRNRNARAFRTFNLRTPSETVKIVGLYLRSRNNYTWYVDATVTQSLDQQLFYLVLTRSLLPNMWRYFSACVLAEKARDDDVLYLGESVLSRCQRALEARDEIGIQFYTLQDNLTRSAMLYHFDYLTLLLAGALDAQARVAWRAYCIQDRERDAHFWYPASVDKLERAGACDLADYLRSQEFSDCVNLLTNLRNTIHGAGLSPLGHGTQADAPLSLLRLHASDAVKVVEAAERRGGTDSWGLKNLLGVELEPYSYALRLTDLIFRAVDRIAADTAVEQLFPPGINMPALSSGPPDSGVYQISVRQRVALLG